MCGRAHSNKSQTQSNNVNARARIFKETANARKQGQSAGARIQKHCEFKETRSLRRRAHSTTPRTHSNKVNAPARAFNKTASSNKECQCAGARIQKQSELEQTISMRKREHSKKSLTQTNKINARARLKETANSSTHDRCANARF